MRERGRKVRSGALEPKMPPTNNRKNFSGGRPALFPHQQALLSNILALYQRDHSEFHVFRTFGPNGTIIRHLGIDETVPAQDGDIVALERAGVIDVVSTDESGISSFAPNALASAFVHPDDYVDLSDEAWAIAKDTLRNRPARIRDVQRLLRGICDDSDAPDTIRDTARAADLLLGHVERYLDPGNPADEPLARASTASLRALAVTILRIGGPEVLGAAVEAFRELLDLFEP